MEHFTEYGKLERQARQEYQSGSHDQAVFHCVRSLREDRLELVSREELERVLEEQKLQVSALVDERTAVEVERLLGVHEILLGKITQIIYVPPVVNLSLNTPLSLSSYTT